jgi:hypothetical protein
MKSKIKWVFILMSVFLAFPLLTCVNDPITLGTEAGLRALWVGNIQVPIEADLDPIDANQWENELFNMNGADFGRAIFNRDTDLYRARIRATVSRGAQVQWGLGMRSTRPPEFIDTRVPITFESDEYIYIKVVSQDGLAINYYRFYTKLLSWATDLAEIAIKVIPVNPDAIESFRVGKAGSPGSTYDEAGEAIMNVTTAESQNAAIIATTYDPNATVQYASVTGDGAPTFQSATLPISFADQDFLYVKVTAENGVDSDIYKYRVNVGRMATINKLFFGYTKEGEPTLEEIFGKGLPNADWAKVSAGDYATADSPGDGYGITIEADDPDASIEYVRVNNKDVDLPAFAHTPANPSKIAFVDDGQVLGIKLTSLNAGVVLYYKVKVGLLPANIKKHPKSAWYYKGTPAAPLTVELDREVPGAIYQWYEADSWYGIYGRHGYELDEKDNVSTVNGGPSQYFFLVQPDEEGMDNPIYDQYEPKPVQHKSEYFAWSYTGAGANTDTITPRTDWNDVPIVIATGKQPVKPVEPDVNFFTGSTSEIRYYWVKITNPATGLSVVSDRALILTETDPGMRHFIFDLSVLPKKNTVPFSVGSKDEDPFYGKDPYKIDLKDYMANDPIAKDLDPNEYMICVAHAQYFLPDGRPWTQNWTHADIHFGYDPGSDKGTLTWWQNNMGANGGAIGLQTPHSASGGLTQKPDWVGFRPSGTNMNIPQEWPPGSGLLPNGIWQMNAPGTPYPCDVAQGYFCGFVEILELRFATAPR